MPMQRGRLPNSFWFNGKLQIRFRIKSLIPKLIIAYVLLPYFYVMLLRPLLLLVHTQMLEHRRLPVTWSPLMTVRVSTITLRVIIENISQNIGKYYCTVQNYLLFLITGNAMGDCMTGKYKDVQSLFYTVQGLWYRFYLLIVTFNL